MSEINTVEDGKERLGNNILGLRKRPTERQRD